MATQTHQLNIKAKLDTSEVRAELDRLNQSRGSGAGGAQGQGTAQRTTQLLSKLDGTLNKLNSTLENLAAAFKQGGMLGGSGSRSPSQNGYIPLSQPFDKMSDEQFKLQMAKARLLAPANLDSVIDSIMKEGKLSYQELKVLSARMPELFNTPTAKAQAVRRIAESVRETPNAEESQPWWNPEIMSPATARKWRGRMQAGFLGHQMGSMGGQIAQLAGGEETFWGRFIGGTSNVLGAGAMGFMVNPLVGALTAAAQAAMEFAKSIVRARMELLQNETKVIAGVAEANRTRWLDLAQSNVLGEETDLQEKQAQARLTKARDRRSDLLDEMARGPSATFDAETRAEIMSGWQALLKDLDQEIKLNKEVLDTIQRRKTALNNEIEANQRLARAEEEFSRNLQLEADLQANRDLLIQEEGWRTNQNRLTEYSRQRGMMQHSFDTEQSLAQIHLGMWNNSTAAEWFLRAAGFRNTIANLMSEADSSEDANEVEEIHRRIGELRLQFSSAMSIANALKDPGMRPNRVDLQSLTSLAGRGGWMGEQYRQPEYMSTLDKMYDTLKSIDDNTRAAEKSVWQ